MRGSRRSGRGVRGRTSARTTASGRPRCTRAPAALGTLPNAARAVRDSGGPRRWTAIVVVVVVAAGQRSAARRRTFGQQTPVVDTGPQRLCQQPRCRSHQPSPAPHATGPSVSSRPRYNRTAARDRRTNSSVHASRAIDSVPLPRLAVSPCLPPCLPPCLALPRPASAFVTYVCTKHASSWLLEERAKLEEDVAGKVLRAVVVPVVVYDRTQDAANLALLVWTRRVRRIGQETKERVEVQLPQLESRSREQAHPFGLSVRRGTEGAGVAKQDVRASRRAAGPRFRG